MIRKPTEELMNELLKANNIGEYLKENSRYMVSDELSTYLNNIISKKGLVKSEVIKKTEFSDVMGYQIFSGTRFPSRDSLICICVAMDMTLDETQAILKIAGLAALYPKSKRDSIVIKGISEKKTVAQINEVLYNCEEKTLT
ncbi:MAG: XRE family transcriptional regulator [Clostridia bacterium]|nr:XRE family transcriptional regulator [Clostridia bacterium]MBR4451758.1 XRE family transcriptional regulator [Clostridia bacterium]